MKAVRISGQKLRVLRTLRVYEPCSCAELARKMDGMDRETVYRCLYQLGELDLVDSPVRACYVLTGKGKLVFNQSTETPLFKLINAKTQI